MSAERFPYLVVLPNFPFLVQASPGVEAQAQLIASRCRDALNFLTSALEYEPRLSLLVLTPEHWGEHATVVPEYGMPQYTHAHAVVVAGQSNLLWQRRARVLLSESVAAADRAAYTRPDGTVDVSTFYNLLPVHELAHAYHFQEGREFARLWLMELFCNLCLHAYVADVEPEQLPDLEALPKATVDAGVEGLSFRSLAEFDSLYTDMEPWNYGWYLCRLHIAAKRIWDAGGIETLKRLWHASSQLDQGLSDAELAVRLREDVHPEVRRVLTEWHV